MAAPNVSCQNVASPDPFAFGLSVFLVVGILGSYLPQHFKIVQAGTSFGLSPWWVLLGTLSSIAGLTNIVTLPASQHDMACCKHISGLACAAAMLGIVQVAVQWTCFMIIMVLFLAFFPRSPGPPDPNISPERDPANQEHVEDIPRPRDAVVVATTCLAALLLAIVGSLVVLVRFPAHLLGWANFLGVAASVMASVQYVPQIWTTYKLGEVLSLSIATMLLQVPGAFLFAFSLYLRVGVRGWSTWLVYCVTGILQGVLLGMAVQFWLRDRRRARLAALPEERRPLLSPHQSHRHRFSLPFGSGGVITTDDGGSTLRTMDGRGTPQRSPIGDLYSATPPEESSDVPSDEDLSPHSTPRGTPHL